MKLTHDPTEEYKKDIDLLLQEAVTQDIISIDLQKALTTNSIAGP